MRVIDADGEQVGIQPLGEAFRAAIEQGLDLVEIAAKSSPPVCRVMDYGKYRYDKEKKEKEGEKGGGERGEKSGILKYETKGEHRGLN